MEHDLNTCVYVHQRFSLLMGKRGAMVAMMRTRWALGCDTGNREEGPNR